MSPVKSGIDEELEAEADQLIFDITRTTTRHGDKADVLTPWKARERRKREIYTGTGGPAPHIRQGVFSRAINPAQPHLNSREGVAAALARRPGTKPLSAYMAETANVSSSVTEGRSGCTGHTGDRPTTCSLGCADSR